MEQFTVGKEIGYVDVPTKEQYDDFREKVNKCIDTLNKRIEILEKGKEKKTPNKECRITVKDSLNNAHCRYAYISENAKCQYGLYKYLDDLARNYPKKLLEIWNKVLTKGQLKCPDQLMRRRNKRMENAGLSAWITAWNPTDPGDVCPKKGDILDCGNGEYKVYRHGKWKPIDYTQVQKPFALDCNEYIQIPFRETLQDDLQLRKKYNLPVDHKRVEDFRKAGKISDEEMSFLKTNKLIKE